MQYFSQQEEPEAEKAEPSVPDEEPEEEHIAFENPDDVPESTLEIQQGVPEEEEEDTVPEIQPVMQWGKITEEIGKCVPAYVKRTLVNSGVAYFGDTLLITAENPLFLTIFKKAENAKILSDTVAEVLGKPYKIRAKCTAEQNCFVNTEETVFVSADKAVIEKPSENQPEPVSEKTEAEIPDTANQSIAEKMKQAQKEHEIQKHVREAQWKMFFENCAGYYQKNSADFFV